MQEDSFQGYFILEDTTEILTTQGCSRRHYVKLTANWLAVQTRLMTTTVSDFECLACYVPVPVHFVWHSTGIVPGWGTYSPLR